MNRKFHHVAVLMGGSSSEREISLLSGQAVSKALSDAGYAVAEVIVDEHDAFTLPSNTEAVFIALHGTFGEDGGVQQVLSQLGIPYTGSSAASAACSFDKILAREAFKAAGVRIPEGTTCVVGEPDFAHVRPPFLPVVVKPPCQGSSVGISIVKSAEAFPKALEEAARYGQTLLLEEYIPGREWSVALVNGTTLPIMEITPHIGEGWYDWTAKYQSGGTTCYTFPEDDPANAALATEVRQLALQAYHAVHAQGTARVDLRISPAGVPYVLELNSIPGCTANSILPRAAAKAGTDFPTLCAQILEAAQCI